MVTNRIIHVWSNKHLHDLLIVRFRIARHVCVDQERILVRRVQEMKVVLSEAQIHSRVRCVGDETMAANRSRCAVKNTRETTDHTGKSSHSVG
jgi:hypothetical protein